MGLVIGVSNGQDFYVGDNRYVLRSREGELHVEDVARNEMVQLFDDQYSELEPDVWVTYSMERGRGMPRLLFDAPRSILILRGSLYRNGKPKEVA